MLLFQLSRWCLSIMDLKGRTLLFRLYLHFTHRLATFGGVLLILISIFNLGTLNEYNCLIPQLKLSLPGMTTMGYRRGITKFGIFYFRLLHLLRYILVILNFSFLSFLLIVLSIYILPASLSSLIFFIAFLSSLIFL